MHFLISWFQKSTTESRTTSEAVQPVPTTEEKLSTEQPQETSELEDLTTDDGWSASSELGALG